MRWNMSNLDTWILTPISIPYDNAKLATFVCWYHLEIFKVDPPKSKIYVVSWKFGKIKMMCIWFHSHKANGVNPTYFYSIILKGN